MRMMEYIYQFSRYNPFSFQSKENLKPYCLLYSLFTAIVSKSIHMPPFLHPKFHFILKAGLHEAYKHEHRLLCSIHSQHQGARKGGGGLQPRFPALQFSLKSHCHPYLLATAQLDFVCSCFISKYIECSKEPRQSKLLDIFVVNILMYSL